MTTAVQRLKQIGSIFIPAFKGFITDNGAEWAAAIAYYALLSSFPLILAGISIGMLFVTPVEVISEASRWLQEFFPAGQGQLLAIIEDIITSRQQISIISILVLLWSGTRVFATVLKALNIAFSTGESYTLLRRTLFEFLMLLTLGVFYLITIAAQFTVSFILNLLFIDDSGGLLVRIGAEVTVAMLVFAALYLTYRFVPRCKVYPKAAGLGAALATALILLARPLFANYVNTFANFNVVYGSVAVIVTFVIWVWVIALIFLLSGEVASHYQAIILERQQPKAVERRHIRRSPTKKDTEGAKLPPKEEEIAGPH